MSDGVESDRGGLFRLAEQGAKLVLRPVAFLGRKELGLRSQISDSQPADSLDEFSPAMHVQALQRRRGSFRPVVLSRENHVDRHPDTVAPSGYAVDSGSAPSVEQHQWMRSVDRYRIREAWLQVALSVLPSGIPDRDAGMPLDREGPITNSAFRLHTLTRQAADLSFSQRRSESEILIKRNGQ